MVHAVEGCVNGFPDVDLIITRASRAPTQATRMNSGFSLMNRFTCDGVITSVVLGVDVWTETATRNWYPEVALWRQRGSDSTYPYQKVLGSGRTVTLTPANFSTSGAFDYTLDPPLTFHANDYLGWYQPELSRSVVHMYQDPQEFTDSDDDNFQQYSDLYLYPVAGELYRKRALPNLLLANYCCFACYCCRVCNF